MKRAWGFFWLIAAAIGGFALWDTFQFASESRNAFMFGMSKMKLALCGGMAVLIITCLTGAVLSLLNRDNIFSSGKAAGAAGHALLFILVMSLIFLTPPVGKTALERSLFDRLRPFFYWAFAFVLLAMLFLLIQKAGALWSFQTSSAPALVTGLVTFLLMTGTVFLSLRTGIGLDPISGTFYRQGVSLLEGQLILPLLFFYPLLALCTHFSTASERKKTERIFTILTVLAIWAAAVWAWQTTTFEGRSYFAPALRAPNNNFYPASDAENYDLLAQSILLGNGFRNGLTVVRPLYAAFLALLHVIFKNDYMRLTNGQILVLAVLPVFAFLIGKRLKHAPAGVLAAVWIIWREVYSIRLSPLVQVSNSRLLMSDLPTALLTAAVIAAGVRWYRNGQHSVTAMTAGGLVGTAMLLRTQCFVLIPGLWLLFLCAGKTRTIIWRSFFISILGLIIVFAPWTVWQRIHPNETANSDVSEGQYLTNLYRTAVNESDPSAGLPDMILHHPSEVARAVGSHFINNEISSLLILPVREKLPAETDELFYEPDLFWYRENARETLEQNRTLVLCYIAIICFGIISAVRKNGFPGIFPFLIHLTYNLGNALAMTSGFRFTLPVDWVILLYFALGCSAILDFVNRILILGFKVLPEKETEPKEEKGVPIWAAATVSTVFLLVIGAVLPLCDSIIPRRFEEKSRQQIITEWKQVSSNAPLILSQYHEDDLVYLEGRAFYPRFYKAGEGDSGGSSSAKRGLDSDRIVWMFHDNRGVSVLNCTIPEEQVQQAIEAPVQDPVDVIIVGIPMEDYIDVLEMRTAAVSGRN